ncbi:MAG: hypothetical protein LBB24_03565 [Rickettsiales bacterium]|jgi:phospholipase/carboxylesterase|nr:hypothetical protein [Rickettsiales bacterium]
MLDFVRRPTRSAGNKYLMFLLHGYYSNGEDIIGLADYFRELSDDFCFIAPNAPQKIADDGYQWFPLDIGHMSQVELHRGASASRKILHDFMEEQIEKLSVEYKNVFLLGFSQGAMMALHIGTRLEARIGGIVSFSGMQPDTTESMKYWSNVSQRVLLLHSRGDSVVPYHCLPASRDMLKNSKFSVVTHTCRNSVDHSIDYDCIEAAKNFVYEIIRGPEDSQN